LTVAEHEAIFLDAGDHVEARLELWEQQDLQHALLHPETNDPYDDDDDDDHNNHDGGGGGGGNQ
jgi:hypothetical protein